MFKKTSVSSISRIKTRLADKVFRNTLGRLDYYREHSPQIAILGNSDELISDAIKSEASRLHAKGMLKPEFLDIGARNGAKSQLAVDFNYRAIDIDPKASHVIYGDICSCPHIGDDSFDVVLSVDVLEHVERPWDAAKECIRITKPGGLLIHRTLFSYRYHPIPKDYWRFTSQGLEYLFTHTNQAETVTKGYDIRARRRDHRGHNLLSKPPIDWLGGFRENWQVLWIGRKAAPESETLAEA